MQDSSWDAGEFNRRFRPNKETAEKQTRRFIERLCPDSWVNALRNIRGYEPVNFSNTEEGPTPPQRKIGPHGGRYTDDINKDGRPYRRYF